MACPWSGRLVHEMPARACAHVCVHACVSVCACAHARGRGCAGARVRGRALHAHSAISGACAHGLA
eukprot:13106965-Alexandrium_andersonii.AAC.1